MGVSALLPYHASLRALGQLLDADRASLLTLCEIHGGFLLQYLAGGDPCAVTSHVLPYAEVLDLVDACEPVTRSQRPRLARLRAIGGRPHSAEHRQPPPTGYKATLHALGHALDRRKARAVVIAELDAAMQVEYTVERAMIVFHHGQRLVAHGRYAQHYTTAQLDDAVHACTAQIAEAVRRAGRHLAENPADVRACLAGAAALEEAGDLAEAERLYRHAVTMVPILREAHYHLARLAFRRGDLAAARHHLQPATTEETGDGRPFHLLARLHDRCREPRAAVAALEQALARDPDNPLYAVELERLHETAGDAPSAEALQGVQSASETEHASMARLDRLGADRATLAPAAVCSEAEPVPHTADVRPGRPPCGSDPAQTPAARDGTAVRASQSLRDAAGPGKAPLDALPGKATCDGLPILGLATANGWERSPQPPLHVPLDSTVAAASLPLAAAHRSDMLPQHDAVPVDARPMLAGATEAMTHLLVMDMERWAETGVAQ